MDKILTVYIRAQPGTNYNFLLKQNWDNCELICHGLDSLMDKLRVSLPDELTIINEPASVNINEIIKTSNGKYLVIYDPNEIWSDDFLKQIKTELLDHPSDEQSVIYGIGFTENNNKINFGLSIKPGLINNNRLWKNFYRANFYGPMTKYILSLDIIKSQHLFFKEEILDWGLKQIIFNLDYLATIYKLNNFSEPTYISFPLGFCVRNIKKLNTENLNIYRSAISSKRSIWESNPWNIIFWLSKLDAVYNTKDII